MNPPTLQKNWVLPEQLLSYIIFEQLYCYEATLVKKYNKLLQQKSETKISTKKRFIKNLLKVNEKKTLGVLRLYQIRFKLLTLSKCLQFNCYQIQRLLAIVTFFLTAQNLKLFGWKLQHFSNSADHSMIETRRLKNVVIFIQTIVTLFWTCRTFSHFTVHVSLEVLY